MTDSRWTTMVRIDTMGRKRIGQCTVVGARFGTCTVLESTSGTRGVGKTTLHCDCTNVFTVTTRQVRRGQVSRCMKCAAKSSIKKVLKEKGIDIIPDSRLRSLWLHRRTGAISRCYNPKAKAYKNYGGRGITFYQPWIDSRTEWLKYVVTLPGWDDPKLEIDRENNHGNYEPGNLRMVTREVNLANRRKAVRPTLST